MDVKEIRKAGPIVRLLLAGLIGFCLFSPAFAQDEAPALQSNDYKIGPKDLLEITVFELPELNQTVRVPETALSRSRSWAGSMSPDSPPKSWNEVGWTGGGDVYQGRGPRHRIDREHQKVSVIGAVGAPGCTKWWGR